VSLLLDENLSPKLVQRLAALFPGMLHVRDVGLKAVSDEAIWRWARDGQHTIVTSDADFIDLSNRLSWPPKVIHIEQCDFPLRVIEDLLRHNAVRISEFDNDPKRGLLSVRLRPGYLR